MAFTFGFYNSLNGDRRYNAEQFGEIFDGILRDGIIPSIGQLFAVTTANNGMQINVGTGRAWFDHTWNKNDSVMVLTVPLSDVTRSRYDAVVLEVNANDEVRTNSIKIVQGEPLVNPVKPTLVNTSKIHQYPLAYIKVEAGAEVIKPSMIENMVGREPTVFATGVLEVVKIDKLWEQWRGEWNEWFEDIKLQLSGNVATNLQYQIDQLKSTALTDSRKATSSEAIAGTNNTKWMTPSTTAAAIDANLGYVKDTYGNKASITVRNPAIITWSKMSPMIAKENYLEYASKYIEHDLTDYIIRFVGVTNISGRSPSAGVNYLRQHCYEKEDYTISIYLEIIRKSDYYYRRTSLGSVSISGERDCVFICAPIPESNKIVYSVGQNLRLATVSSTGVSTNVTIDSAFRWASDYSARNMEAVAATSKNYAAVGVKWRAYSGSDFAYAYMCNVSTYAKSNSNLELPIHGCVTNSGMFYGNMSGSVGSTNGIIFKEVNLNSWATATYQVNIQSYQPSYPNAYGYTYNIYYDWIYDRIVYCCAATSSSSSQNYIFFALFNGRTVTASKVATGTVGNANTINTSYISRDVSSHTAGWLQYTFSYTASSVTFRSISAQYGALQSIISGYGFLTSKDIVLPTAMSSYNWLDRRIINDVEVAANTLVTTTNPLGLRGIVTLDTGRAYVTFKLTNTEYIRD